MGENIRSWFYDHCVTTEKESHRHVRRLSHHLHRRSESYTQAAGLQKKKDDMSLVDGSLSRDTFDYAQDLARVDGKEDNFHVHLFSHDRRAARASKDWSRRVACLQVTRTVVHGSETCLVSDATQPPISHRINRWEGVVQERLAGATTLRQLT